MPMNKKKVLILVSEAPKPSDQATSLNWIKLRDWVQQKIGDKASITIAAFPDFVYRTGTITTITHAEDNYDMADFDLVIARTVGKSLELAIATAHYLQAKNIPFADEYILTQGKGKLSCGFIRALNGLPVPDTVYARPAQIIKFMSTYSPFKYPFVLKADEGKKGNDNHLIRSDNHLKEVLASTDSSMAMLAQEYIPNDGDYRLLILNKTPKLLILRTAAKGTHLNNTSQGGSAVIKPLSSLDPRIIEDSLAALKLERLQYAGVDVVINKQTGAYYFLEVNRAPQIPTGAFADKKVTAYAEAIYEALNMPRSAKSKLTIVGRAERVDFVENDISNVPAKVDTGADLSSIWATDIQQTKDGLSFILFGEGSEFYTGKKITFSKSEYGITRVANSFGQREIRYVVKLSIRLNGRRVKASFTLADRSSKLYPILIGRRLLNGKFVVDVSTGRSLSVEERDRKKKLKQYISKLKDMS